MNNNTLELSEPAVPPESDVSVATSFVALKSLTVVDFTVVPVNPNNPVVTPAAPIKYGNYAQWAAVIAAILLGLLNMWLIVSYHSESKTTVSSDEHINSLIGLKLDPAKEKINEHIDQKVDDLGKKIDGLSDRVSRIEGSLGKRVSAVEDKVNQQTSLARLIDPSRVLATIRAEIELAQARGKLLPVSDVNDFRNAVQALPASAHEYWTTVAAIINYQSLLNQMSGEAPDPAKVSKPCSMFTNGRGNLSIGNVFGNMLISNCVVDLDTQTFSDVTFKNSVVRYRGGPVTLERVAFINCRFILELQTPPSTPTQKNLLLALLASPDQKSVQVSR
jgi:hypothetical protein